MNKLIWLLLSSAFVIGTKGLNAQILKHLDLSDLYRNASVERLEVNVVKYVNNAAQDSCMREVVRFDYLGRVTRVQNYFACGKLFSEEHIYYNDNGKVEKMTFSGKECRWDTLEYTLTRDDKNRIVMCSMRDSISQQSRREVFTYGQEGNIIKWQKQRLFADNWSDSEQKIYPDYVTDRKKRTKNTVSHIYNRDGLIINESFVQPNGKVERGIVFEYFAKGGL
jgi:hypothetical protein